MYNCMNCGRRNQVHFKTNGRWFCGSCLEQKKRSFMCNNCQEDQALPSGLCKCCEALRDRENAESELEKHQHLAREKWLFKPLDTKEQP